MWYDAKPTVKVIGAVQLGSAQGRPWVFSDREPMKLVFEVGTGAVTNYGLSFFHLVDFCLGVPLEKRTIECCASSKKVAL